jgi:hypothetical protein
MPGAPMRHGTAAKNRAIPLPGMVRECIVKHQGRGHPLMLDNAWASPSFDTLRLGAWTIGIVASCAHTL